MSNRRVFRYSVRVLAIIDCTFPLLADREPAVARVLVTYVLNAGDVGFFQGIGTQFVHSQRSFPVLAIAAVKCADIKPSDPAAQSDDKSPPM